MYKLDEIPTTAPKSFDKSKTKELTRKLLEELDALQYLLYAQSKYSVLIVLQGPDASGKDGVIRKVFGNLNPQGVRVQSFKVPTEEELAHDFLWRIHRYVPQKGMVQIFNRSHYEDVLVTRVHNIIDDKTAYKRFDAINDFEELLSVHNNTQILKFYLHISPEEQKERLKERTEDETKKWKYNKQDGAEAKHYNEYRNAYEDVFEHCSAIPWTIVPADQNWYKEYLVAKQLVDTLKSLEMKFPDIKKEEKPKL